MPRQEVTTYSARFRDSVSMRNRQPYLERGVLIRQAVHVGRNVERIHKIAECNIGELQVLFGLLLPDVDEAKRTVNKFRIKVRTDQMDPIGDLIPGYLETIRRLYE